MKEVVVMESEDLVKELKNEFEYVNESGSLVQLVHGGYSQVNVVCSYAGTNRGGHLHKLAREAFYVIDGSLEIKLWRGKEILIKKYGRGDFFEVQPKVMHSMFFYTNCIMVVLYDIPIENNKGIKDIYVEEVD